MSKSFGFKDGFFAVYFAPCGGKYPHLVASCASADIAIAVAFNLHQLSNCPHVISVETPDKVEIFSLKRLDVVDLKFQSNNAR